MAARSVTTTGLDHEAIVKGIGELKVGGGSARVVVGSKTLAYLKTTRIAVRAPHGSGSPKSWALPCRSRTACGPTSP
jgi:hypothetical protein